MILKIFQKKIRPLSPHLFIYKIQKNSYKSIKKRLLILYSFRLYLFMYLKWIYISNLNFQIFQFKLNFLIYNIYFNLFLILFLFILSHILKELLFKISNFVFKF
uniref:succinate:cytochrome c oxidoreductase subunit 3 n=1 Tax=Neorhodella cyanea TaxID=131155 RepID=UPI001FCD098F|nr:succinate:cytochrome c oxidoreductase subunit 3 [Neorhodella cyanea]UNJ18797.1 succinate:cytochrome c oxidoreductase subunit 3 [Neorhodella cyanea]